MQQGDSNIMSRGDDLYTRLWKACAGPVVNKPNVDQLVYYFPQGQLEQFEASADHDESNQPIFNLPSKILCRVIDVRLLVEQETDDVYAQITLLPQEADTTESTSINFYSAEPLRATVQSFFKVLTASDVGKRYELYVRKKDASKCFPPLDMSEKPPEQLLVAVDLHGKEWTFKHTFGGQPPRHLLTTGWNKFVTAKKLVAGDRVVFLRGQDEELRVGVYRLACSKSSFLSSGEAALNATLVGSPFVVKFKPRLSQVIIPLNKYTEALTKKFSPGMKIKMPLELEDFSEKGFKGTIVETGNICHRKWPDSAWRCLEIQWDGPPPSSRRPEYVSPWEIVSYIQTGEELAFPVLRKGKKKLHMDPEDQVEGLDTRMAHRPMRASSKDPCDRLDDRCPNTMESYHEEGCRMGTQNDMVANLSEDAILQVTNEIRGSLADLLGDNFFQNETQAQPQGSFTNRNLISGISSNDQLGHIRDFDIPHSLASDGINMSFMNYFQGIDLKELGETSSHLQPFLQTCAQMPLEGSVPLTSQASSSNKIYISPIPSLISYNGPGHGDELVPWGRYLVARRRISVLEMIIAQNPEWLSSFTVKTEFVQSVLLEILAEVVYRLEHLTVGTINRDQLDAIKPYLNDLKLGGIEVDRIERRMQHIDAVLFKKERLVQRQAELSQEVEMTGSKLGELKGELESVGKELVEVTSKIGTHPPIADHFEMQGLL